MNSWNKGVVKWVVGKTLYLSVPFTWLLEEAEGIADRWHGDVVMGGPAFMEETHCENFSPILFHNPLATFTTRGCPNSCGFCAVPHLEPEFKEIKDFRPAPIICDNNLLASSKKHIRRVVDKVRCFDYVDFNQGLEAGRFTPDIADMLGELNCKVRFAFDSLSAESHLKDAIDLCRKRTTNDIGVYCLIGFNDSPESAKYRLEKVREWGIRPNPMRFQPLNTKHKNTYIKEGWTERELKMMVRYYSRLRWLEHISYDDYFPQIQMELFT